MMEHVVSAIIALEAGFKGYFIVPPQSYAAETLVLLGVAADKIIVANAKPCRLETVYIPTPLCARRGQLRNYPHLIQAIRDRLLRAVGTQPPSPMLQRIYVPRPYSTSSVRRIVNELELMDLLRRYNFATVLMEQLSLRDQIVAACGATCILGPHGAGMVHSLFMAEESLVVELFSPTYINPCLLPIIEHLRHRYFIIPSDMHGNYAYGEDIQANIPVLDVTLKRELSR
jgi:capsular polysaccharide biosynthesis protein